MPRRHSLSFLLAVLVLAPSARTAVAGDDAPVVALLPGVVDPFYLTMRRGAEKAASEEHVELVFQIPRAWNTADQVPILRALVARKPAVLIIAPVDKLQLIRPLKEAQGAGIKIITVDTYIDDGKYQDGKGPGDFPLSYIASDNVEGGRLAARALARALGDKGTVYCENNKPGISSTDQRTQGFLEEMKAHPGITVLPTQYNEDDANRAAANVAAVLARTPGLAGVFGVNTFSGMGAAEGVKRAGKSGKIKVVVFDAVPGIDKQIKSGLIDIAIAQKAADIGYWGVKYAAAAARGKPIPAERSTGFVVMDKTNIDQPDIHQYIYSN